MNYTKPKVEILDDHNPYRLVEKVGRICYDSLDKMTDTSYKTFVQNAIKNEHFAMLEHAYFDYAVGSSGGPLLDNLLLSVPGTKYQVFSNEGYYAVRYYFSLSHLYNPRFECAFFHCMRKRIEWEYGFSMTDEAAEYTPNLWFVPAYSYVTLLFTTDCGISHELVRHRYPVMESSTRYCNFSKDKYESQAPFTESLFYRQGSPEVRDVLDGFLDEERGVYNKLIDLGGQPEDARYVLSKATRAKVALTMDEDGWKHFLNLRLYGTTGKPHKDMQVVALAAEAELAKAYGWKQKGPYLERNWFEPTVLRKVS